MADNNPLQDSDLFSQPSENSGPAILDREPILLPNQRRDAARKVKDALGQ